MKITARTAHVDLRLQFTVEEAQTLILASEHHYSAECRPEAFKPIAALKNLVAQTIYALGPPEFDFTWRDMDILSKICESELVPPDTSRAVWAAFAELRRLDRIASAVTEEPHSIAAGATTSLKDGFYWLLHDCEAPVVVQVEIGRGGVVLWVPGSDVELEWHNLPYGWTNVRLQGPIASPTAGE